MPDHSLSAATPALRGVIVAGMHRSSTSLVCSLFRAAGLWCCDDQVPPDIGNPRGYFEDRPVHLLHRQMLESYDAGWDLSPRLRELRREQLPIPGELRSQVRDLVETYRAHEPWVWKNPRATLFLDAWADECPEATFVICVREPAAVIDSLLRRRSRMRIYGWSPRKRLHRVLRGLSLWYTYNLMAFRFARRHPDRAVIVRVPDDLGRLQHADLYDPGDLRRPRWQLRLLTAFAFRSRLLHRRLRRLAEPPRLDGLLPEALPARRAGEAGAAAVWSLVAVAASSTVGAAVDAAYNVVC